jgi:OmpA-OmpF porin, OOP family
MSSRLPAVAVVCGILLSPSVYAADWYAGLGVGRTHAAYTEEDFSADFSGDMNNRFSGWRFLFGYRISERWAVEAAYTDFGRTKTSNGSNLGVPVDFNVDGQAASLSLAASWPFHARAALVAKWGFTSWKDTVASDQTGASADTDSGTDSVYGLGLRYTVGPGFDVGLDWESYQDIDDEEPTDVDVISVGMIFRF